MTRILVDGQEVLRLTRDSWEESKHPRANNGQFGHGSGTKHGPLTQARLNQQAEAERNERLREGIRMEAELQNLKGRYNKLSKNAPLREKVKLRAEIEALEKKINATTNRSQSKGKGKDWRPELETAQPEAAKPLYAAFRLTQLSEDLLASWASSYGLSLPRQPHVTVAYSRAPVDARRLPQMTAGMVIPPGGRSLEQFGDDVVLCVQCPDLDKVWQAYRDAGASWDYPSYRPHITIARWQKLESLKDVPAFDEPITLGPEWRDTLKEHWHSDAVEVAA